MTKSQTQLLWFLWQQCIKLPSRGRLKVNPNSTSFPPAQGLVLQELARSDGMTQKALQEKLQITQPSMTELLMKLEKGQYVQRTQNQEDKRVINVYLTPKSRELCNKIKVLRDNMANDMFKALSYEEQESLAKLLTKLIEAWNGDNIKRIKELVNYKGEENGQQ